MALITCPECGNQVSDKASACIHCGYPLSSECLSENAPITTDEPIVSTLSEIAQSDVATDNFPKRLDQSMRQTRVNGGIATGIYLAITGLITVLALILGGGSVFRSLLCFIPYGTISFVAFYKGINSQNKKTQLWKKFFVVALCVLFAIPPISFATLVAGVLTPQCGFFIFILLVLGGLLLLISIILCVITKTKVPKAHIEDTIQQ